MKSLQQAVTKICNSESHQNLRQESNLHCMLFCSTALDTPERGVICHPTQTTVTARVAIPCILPLNPFSACPKTRSTHSQIHASTILGRNEREPRLLGTMSQLLVRTFSSTHNRVPTPRQNYFPNTQQGPQNYLPNTQQGPNSLAEFCPSHTTGGHVPKVQSPSAKSEHPQRQAAARTPHQQAAFQSSPSVVFAAGAFNLRLRLPCSALCRPRNLCARRNSLLLGLACRISLGLALRQTEKDTSRCRPVCSHQQNAGRCCGVRVPHPTDAHLVLVLVCLSVRPFICASVAHPSKPFVHHGAPNRSQPPCRHPRRPSAVIPAEMPPPPNDIQQGTTGGLFVTRHVKTCHT
jgi:hypothetical protein